MSYAGIVEVVEVNRRRCNDLLERGYTLLNISNVSKGQERPRSEGQTGPDFYVVRYANYIVGRRENQRPFQEVFAEIEEELRVQREAREAARTAVEAAS